LFEDLKRLVKDLFEQYNYINNASYVKKKLKINGNIPFCSGIQRISVILSNLISNGLKYADLRKAKPFLLLDINIGKNQVLISVEDNGEGIPRDYRNKIFEMFVRASSNSTGSGLGLYIVKEVLEKLNGSIQVYSEYGKKTIFTVSIPNLG
jgi:signal transduction histidine kinase